MVVSAAPQLSPSPAPSQRRRREPDVLVTYRQVSDDPEANARARRQVYERIAHEATLARARRR